MLLQQEAPGLISGQGTRSHVPSSYITLWQIDRKQWKQQQTLFFWASKSLWAVTAAMKLKDSCSLEGNYDKPRQPIKKQRHHFGDKGHYSQKYGFSSSHVWM